jgi:hypothetical protein
VIPGPEVRAPGARSLAVWGEQLADLTGEAMMRALEPWHLMVLVVVLAIPVLLVVLVVRASTRRLPGPAPQGSASPPPAVPVFTDPATGRRYTVDPANGQSRWLDTPPPPPDQT